MPDQTITSTTSQKSAAFTWPGGWYVCENGQVNGPFSATEAFSMTAAGHDGRPRLVSRKGFSQWYALSDLSEIFRVTEQFGRQVSAEAEITEADIASMRLAAGARENAVPPAPPKRIAKTLQVQSSSLARPVAGDAAINAAASPAAAVGVQHSPTVYQAPGAAPRVAKTITPATRPAPAGSVDAPTGQASTSMQPAQAQAQALTRQQVLQEYFLARGRLRLGRLKNAWLTACVGVPLTLGAVWVLWFRELSREVSMHTKNAAFTTLPPAIWALVPGVHIYMVYRLARLMAEMEAQNRYRATSPALAAGLSLLPPLAMIYLQRAANNHWLLHARHGASRRAAVVA